MSLAFEGVRVLDFSQVIAGPMASLLLRQLGAEVIKIESRGGDQMRGLFRGKNEPPEGSSEAFANLNRGKRSVSIDLKSEAGREAIFRIAERCDVVLENFRPGAMTRLGLTYDAFKAVKPDIIYCSTSGFGQVGPLSERPAYDSVIQAISGMMTGNGHPETGPTRTNYMPVDFTTGFIAAFAISSALLRRSKTGEGQRIDIAMLDVALQILSPAMSRYLASGDLPPLFGNRSPTGWPTSDCFATLDGHILTATALRSQAVSLMNVIGLPPALLDEYMDLPIDSPRALEIVQMIRDGFKGETSREWCARLASASVPAEMVQDLDEVAEMEHLRARQILREPTAEDKSDARFVYGGLFLANADGPSTQGASPETGGETIKVLQESGFSDAEIAALREAGAL